MLDKLKLKAEINQVGNAVKLHKCKETGIFLNEQFDFILVFYMFHEVPDQNAALREFKTLLKPGGKLLIPEPKIHVSKTDFR